MCRGTWLPLSRTPPCRERRSRPEPKGDRKPHGCRQEHGGGTVSSGFRVSEPPGRGGRGQRRPGPVLTTAPSRSPVCSPSSPEPMSWTRSQKSMMSSARLLGRPSPSSHSKCGLHPRGPWNLPGLVVGQPRGPGRASPALVGPPSAWLPAAAEGAAPGCHPAGVLPGILALQQHGGVQSASLKAWRAGLVLRIFTRD